MAESTDEDAAQFLRSRQVGFIESDVGVDRVEEEEVKRSAAE